MLYFFSAGRAFTVLKKMHLPASDIFAPDHQRFSAFFTGFLNKRLFSAIRTGNIKRPSASGADSVSLFNHPQTAGAGVAKRTMAAAFGA
jgi:hypothetical protein